MLLKAESRGFVLILRFLDFGLVFASVCVCVCDFLDREV